MNTVNLLFKQTSRTLKQLFKEQAKVVAVVMALMPAMILLLPYLLQMLSRGDISLLIRAVIFSSFTLGVALIINKLHQLCYGSNRICQLTQLAASKSIIKASVVLVDLIVLTPVHLLLALAYFYVAFENDLSTNVLAFNVFLLAFYGIIILSCFYQSHIKAFWLVSFLTYIFVHGYLDTASLLVMAFIGLLFIFKTWLVRYIFRYRSNRILLTAYLFRKPMFLCQSFTVAFIYLMATYFNSIILGALLFIVLFNLVTVMITTTDRAYEVTASYLDVLTIRKRSLLTCLSSITFATCLLPATAFIIALYFDRFVWGSGLLIGVSTIFLLPKRFINYKLHHSLVVANAIVCFPLTFEVLAHI
ncbi:hypothetical protein [Pleionea mediterranea]|uniref:Uncharacterized protein n=1 Tax=Pleionea mediterranea TaxID=523701 RepID=A0A316FYE1_9GAMM|nr:hypothetical protein [Pleionea mediterranea]PWK53443.1 hypothetical protein C8D97_103270 [Pleionea mediterranea]